MDAAITHCRICGSSALVEVFSLGNIAVSDFVREQKPITTPLALVMCDPHTGCALVQLKYPAVNPETMYRQYWYKSGTNQTMRTALADITEKAEQVLPLHAGNVVIDIGANDGTLLRSYRVSSIQKVGFEPAKNLAIEASVGGNRIINDFFNASAFQHLGLGKANIITSIAMFYDLEDPNTFVRDILDCLAPGGIWIIQLAYEPVMLAQNGFDNIVHEHVEYYSLKPLEILFGKQGLEIFDVELNDVNGGSIRCYIRRKKETTNQFPGAAERVARLRADEEQGGWNTLAAYEKFSLRVQQIRQQTVDFIRERVAEGKIIHVYGASTKGNTLLQYFGLDHRLIAAAAERNPDKWGLKTVITDIPIISEEESRKAKPVYYFVLPWHFLDEFVKREARYLQNGGHFIVPLPEFRII